MKQLSFQAKWLLLPILFLAVLTVLTYLSLTSTKKTIPQISNLQNDQTESSRRTVLATRAPASIEKTARTNLIYDCKDSKNNLGTVKSDSVVVELKNCGAAADFKKIKMLNTTTEYVAQIFKSSDGKAMTDFIQLKMGQNLLKLEFSLNDKQTQTQTLKIQRHQ